VPSLAPEVIGALLAYDWPGNIRELENMLERAIILSSGSIIHLEDLPFHSIIPSGAKLTEVLELIEKKMITQALINSGHVQARAAELLGIEKNLLKYKMKKYALV
jgi:two-component system NtrC family response regulator